MKLAMALLLTAMASPAVAQNDGDERNWKFLTQTLGGEVNLVPKLTQRECEEMQKGLDRHSGVVGKEYVVRAVCFQ